MPIHCSRPVSEIGLSCTLSHGAVDADLLSTAGTLVLVNPRTPYTDSEIECIWDFVSKGGSLLVLDDHTVEGGPSSPSNALLGRVPITLRFDSALSSRVDWVGCYSIGCHPALARLDTVFRDNTDLYWGTGASLEVGPGAITLLSARFGFSDIGDAENREKNLLGDYMWEQQERLGDLVLAAQASYGKGKVVVFGDTSSLQNRPLVFTFDTLVGPLFSWLNRPSEYFPLPSLCLLGLAVSSLALLALRQASIRRMAGWLVIPFVVTAAACVVGSGVQAVIAGREYAPPTSARTAIIDYSHGEDFDRTVNPSPKGISGLCMTLVRLGYLPRVTKASRVHSTAMVSSMFLVSPMYPIPTRETTRLLRYAEAGGHVIVSAGFPNKRAVEGILSWAGVTISNVPLGPVPMPSSQDPRDAQFVEAWQMGVGSERTTTLYETKDRRVLATQCPVGEGFVTVVSDPRFFLDKNIEGQEIAYPVNMQFVAHILSMNSSSERGGSR